VQVSAPSDTAIIIITLGQQFKAGVNSETKHTYGQSIGLLKLFDMDRLSVSSYTRVADVKTFRFRPHPV